MKQHRKNQKQELKMVIEVIRLHLNVLNIRRVLWLAFIVQTSFVWSQPTGQMTEAEVNLQKVYIEANKEKLLGNDDDAIVLFSEVLSKQPNNAAANFEVARLFQKKGELRKAETFAKKAIEAAPNNLWFNEYYAKILSENGEHAQAARVYENLVKQYPEGEQLYFDWAYMLVKAGAIKDAIEVYDELEELVGIDERVTKRKLALFQAQGKNKKAEAELLKLTKAFPNEVTYMQMLARFYEQTNRDEDAKVVYGNILELEPDNSVANMALAQTFKENGQEEKYLKAIDGLFKNPDVDIDLKIKELVPYIKKISTYKRRDEMRKLLLDLGETLTLVHPDDAKAYAVYGDLLYHANESNRALEVYKSTLERDRSVFLVWEQVMYILKDLKDADELLTVANDAANVFPNQAAVYFMSGTAYSMLARYDDAVNDLEQALMMSRGNTMLQNEIYTELGKIYHQQKKWAKSEQAFEDALKMQPRSAQTLNAFAYSLAERGEQLPKAEQLASSANQLAPNQFQFQDTYGWVLFKAGDYKKAERWVKKSLDNGGSTDARTLEHYGDVLFKLNQVEEAVQYWQKSVDNGGNSQQLKKKISNRTL